MALLYSVKMSSIATLNEDTYKSWVNPRVNNLTVDGTLTSNNISFITSVTIPTYLENTFAPNTANVTIYLTKIGNVVFMQMDQSLALQNGTAGYPTTNTAIPVGFRPATEQRMACGVVWNAAQLLGAVVVTTTGLVVFNLCGVDTTLIITYGDYPASSTQAGIEGISMSWNVL
jgi:hypothetical protein